MNPYIKDELDYTEVLLSPLQGVSDTMMSSMYNMTPVTIKLFAFVLAKLATSKKDYVYFRVDEIMDTMNVKSKDSVYTAIKELESIKVLCKKQTNEYWINPFNINLTPTDYFKTILRNIVRDNYPNLFIKTYTNESKL